MTFVSNAVLMTDPEWEEYVRDVLGEISIVELVDAVEEGLRNRLMRVETTSPADIENGLVHITWVVELLLRNGRAHSKLSKAMRAGISRHAGSGAEDEVVDS